MYSLRHELMYSLRHAFQWPFIIIGVVFLFISMILAYYILVTSTPETTASGIVALKYGHH